MTRRIITLLLVTCTASLAQTHIHRSIQSGTAARWTSGGTITFTISSDTIGTFSSDAPDSIGRGMAIEYDSTGSSSVKAICFIKYRISKRQFGVQRFQGGNPAPASATTTWNIFHAYTSWDNFDMGDENDGINNTVENFDGHGGGLDMDARGEKWFVAVYAGDHTAIANGFDGINTSSTERLVVYAPCGTKYVGTSQRHNGTLTATRALFSSTGNGMITNDDSGVRVMQHLDLIGLQFSITGTGGTYALLINQVASEACDITITDCLFSGSDSVSTVASTHVAIQWSTGTASVGSSVKIKNCLFYGWKTAGATTNEGGVHFTAPNIAGTLLINNCTFYKCELAIKRTTAGNTLTVKNSISNRSADGFNGGIGGSYNVSDIASDCGSCTNMITGTVAFTSQATKDFSLQSGDTVAKNAGQDLSADALPVTTDIKNYTRSGTYDVGAFEQGAAASGCSTETDPITDTPVLKRRRNPVQ